MEKKDVLRKIGEIKASGRKLDEKIHEVAVACLVHARDSGDVTLATRLVAAMPRSGRRKALVSWFTAHGRLNFSSKDEAFKLAKGTKDLRTWMVEEAQEVPFWDYTEEKEPTAITVKTVLSRLNSIIEGKGKAPIEDDAQALAAFLMEKAEEWQREPRMEEAE